MRHHDLVVIGTGSGNSIIDDRFDHLDVALVEHGVFGGTCLNVGCIPTKMYVYPAAVARQVQRAGTYGLDATLDKVRWTEIRDRVFGRIDPISAGGREYRVGPRTPNITVYEGHAAFTGPKAFTIAMGDGGTEAISADRVVLAAGARPSVPDVIAASGVPFHTSDTIMRIDEVPEHLIVVGAGYIGAEFAHVFSSFGSRVTIIGRGDRLLRSQDEDVAERFTAAVRDRWDVRLGHAVAAVAGGPGAVEVELTDGSVIGGDVLLVATGRVPNGDRLNLPAAGVAVHGDGRVVVDAHGRTTADGVWALGDVCSPFQLKHVANAEGRVVAHNLANPGDLRSFDHHAVPWGVFTDPQIAGVGLTEAQCREQRLDYVTKVQAYGDVAYGWAMEDTVDLCKVIAERGTGRILGAHVMGPQATTVIQPLIQAMAFGQDARAVATGQYWIHPALPEVVENALLGLDI